MIAENISRKNRLKKYNLFLQKVNLSVTDKILDVGFTNIEYSSVDNYLEKNYSYLSNITALGIDANNIFNEKYPEVNVVIYDGKNFPFDDKSFDVGWSNAVLEHVGNEDAQIKFLKELNRTCKRAFFTTPNRFFLFELHTRLFLLHWLPKSIFDKILSSTSSQWAAGDYMHLLSKQKLITLLKRANITNYHIYHNRFLGWTMDFSVVF